MTSVADRVGGGWLSTEANTLTPGTLAGFRTSRGPLRHQMWRLPTAGAWLTGAPSSWLTPARSDFAPLSAGSVIRAELLDWIATCAHASDDFGPMLGRLTVQDGTTGALGLASGATLGPYDPATAGLDAAATWQTVTTDPTYGLYPLPMVDAPDARVMLVPWWWGRYDVTADGAACHRTGVHHRHHLTGLGWWLTEPCELSGAFTAAHPRGVHFPWMQTTHGHCLTSSEPSAGLGNGPVTTPPIGSSNMTVSCAPSDTTLTWTGSPPSNADWTPFLSNGVTITGGVQMYLVDPADPTNIYETLYVTGIKSTAANHSTGELTVSRRRHGGEPSRTWTNAKLHMARWASGSISSLYTGTPGPTGTLNAVTRTVISPTTLALSTATAVWSGRAYNLAGQLAPAYFDQAARATWAVVAVDGTTGVPVRASYTFTGTETVTDLMQLTALAQTRVAVDERLRAARFAAGFGRRVAVYHSGEVLDADPFHYWNTNTGAAGTMSTAMVRALVRGVDIQRPSSLFMLRSYNYNGSPVVCDKPVDYWCVQDAVLVALTWPGIYTGNPADQALAARFGHGVTHDEASATQTPDVMNRQDIAAWRYCHEWARSGATYPQQARGVASLANSDLPYAMEWRLAAAVAGGGGLPCPYWEMSTSRGSSPTADVAAPYLGWAGSSLTDVGAYLAGYTTGTLTPSSAYSASHGQRARAAAVSRLHGAP